MDEATVLAMIKDHFDWASRDEVRASEIYADDVVLEFPQSQERTRGKANVIAFRTAYPANVTFEMHRTIGCGDLWVMRARSGTTARGLTRWSASWSFAMEMSFASDLHQCAVGPAGLAGAMGRTDGRMNAPLRVAFDEGLNGKSRSRPAPGRRDVRALLASTVAGALRFRMAHRLALEFPLISWLLTDARRIAEPKAFLAGLAEQLLHHGIEVARLTTGVPILHPQVHSYSAKWELGQVSERFFRLTAETLPTLQNSPVKTVYSGGGSVRCDPTTPPRDGEFGILADLRREGMTDYVALSIPFSDGTSKLLTVATKRPGGFSDEEMELLETMTPGVAVNLEVQALRLTARTLLDTYVGRQAGARVLEGAIRRGMGETIRAVIWLCDLRGFTNLSEQLPRDALIELLNAYFGRMCAAIDGGSGEVLKFIGDALLGIFPIHDEDTPSVCARALAAAKNAQEELATFNIARIKAGEASIDYGIALHVGDVMYGNIGGENRLDFTVIGPAVNLASRIEGLCRDLGRPVLLSQGFVAASAVAAEHLGTFSLKGLSDPQQVYAPPGGTGEGG